MNYKLRALKAKDAMTVLGLIQRLGLREPIKAIFESDWDNLDEQKFGFDIIDALVEAVIPNVEKHEQEVHAFLGDLANLSPEEVAELPLADYVGLYIAFFTHKDFKGLGQQVTLFLKK